MTALPFEIAVPRLERMTALPFETAVPRLERMTALPFETQLHAPSKAAMGHALEPARSLNHTG